MTVWFDVEDLFDYVHAGHRRVSGIQRLTLEIYRAAADLGGIGFVRHAPAPAMFKVVPWTEVAALFGKAAPPWWRRLLRAGASLPSRRSPSGVWRRVRRTARAASGLLPDRVRGPLVLASVMQVQAAAQLGLFAAGLSVDSARLGARVVRRRLVRPVQTRMRTLRGRTTAHAWPDAQGPFRNVAAPGDTLLVLGSPWFRQEYGALARWLRDEMRVGFGVLMCDLVPVRHPEWCDDGVRRSFRAWYSAVLPFCDLVLAISRHTAEDVEAYASELGIVLPRAVRVLPIGTGFGAGPAPADGGSGGGPEPGAYVLFVSTIEARKTHALAVEVWRRLLDEVRSGVRPASTVPDLVFAGRVGWLVADLMQELANSEWLGGRVRLVQGPTDAELQALYDGCLFTLLPSLHEGWGLPVTESLARGAPCLCSNVASLPEAGGDLCRYFDPESVRSAHEAVAAVLDDREGLAAWRERVRREFRPVPWTDTARTVLEEAAAAVGGGAEPR